MYFKLLEFQQGVPYHLGGNAGGSGRNYRICNAFARSPGKSSGSHFCNPRPNHPLYSGVMPGGSGRAITTFATLLPGGSGRLVVHVSITGFLKTCIVGGVRTVVRFLTLTRLRWFVSNSLPQLPWWFTAPLPDPETSDFPRPTPLKIFSNETGGSVFYSCSVTVVRSLHSGAITRSPR